MKNIKFFVFALLNISILSVFNATPTFTAEMPPQPLSESANIIVEGLKEQGIARQFQSNPKLYKPQTSLYADKILFIRSKSSCQLAAKVFKDNEEYAKENNLLLKDQDALYAQTINDLRTICGLKLPILIERKGSTIIEGKGVVVLTAAKGKTLENILNNINNMADEEIKNQFEDIGSQLGNLDALLYHEHNHILKHPDSLSRNIMYDENEKQVYWIDTAGLHYENKGPDIRSYAFIAGMLRDIVVKKGLQGNSIYIPEHILYYSKDEAEIELHSIKKHLLALQSIYIGYASSMQDSGLKRSIKQAYQDMLHEGVMRTGIRPPPSLQKGIDAINKGLNLSGADAISTEVQFD